MVLDDLKELLMAKAISFEQYKEATVEALVAHTRESSVEKEAPVKKESLDTETQEALVETEAPIKSEAPVKMEDMWLEEVSAPAEYLEPSLAQPITVEALVKTEAPVKMGDLWLEDIDAFGNVRCRQCGSCFPGGVEHCEECEDHEVQTRIQCTPQEEIYLPSFVARDPVTGLLHVKLEPTYEEDDAFNEFIRCFENLPLEAPKANASNLKATLESIVQWFLWQQKPNHKIFVEQTPSDLTPFGESSVTDTSWACCQNFGVYVGMLCLEEHGVAATCVGVRRTGAAFGDPRVEDPGVEGREDVSGACELTLTRGTERATRGGRAAPLY